MKRIILDTNSLMIPLQFRVDIFSEIDRVCNFNYTLCIFRQTIDELKGIIERNEKGRKAAQFALKLINSKNIDIIDSERKGVDSLILENADENTIVATQDKELKKQLIKRGIAMIVLRQKKYLKLIEGKLYK